MARLHKKELLAQNALKAQEMKISLDYISENLWSALKNPMHGTSLM